METKFNFKSQICTDRIQSERLLALGIKRETADCYWFYCDIVKEWKCTILSSTQVFEDYPTTVIPAWSLGRLWELMPKVVFSKPALHLTMCGDSVFYCTEDNNEAYEKPFSGQPNIYDNIIDCIEWLIKEGYFNKKYLENGNC